MYASCACLSHPSLSLWNAPLEVVSLAIVSEISFLVYLKFIILAGSSLTPFYRHFTSI